MSNPPLPKEDQKLLDNLKLSFDCYGQILYRGVIITQCLSAELWIYYYLLPGSDKQWYMLGVAMDAVDKVLKKLNDIGEPWD